MEKSLESCKMTDVLSSSLPPALAFPLLLTTTTGLSMLLSALGEVSNEESDPLQACILAQLSCPSAAVRQQVAQVNDWNRKGRGDGVGRQGGGKGGKVGEKTAGQGQQSGGAGGLRWQAAWRRREGTTND